MKLKGIVPALVVSVLSLFVVGRYAFGQPPQAKPATLLNVSYDPTRELYVDFNKAFAAYWKGKTGQAVEIKQSHAGSGAQARSGEPGCHCKWLSTSLAASRTERCHRLRLDLVLG